MDLYFDVSGRSAAELTISFSYNAGGGHPPISPDPLTIKLFDAVIRDGSEFGIGRAGH